MQLPSHLYSRLLDQPLIIVEPESLFLHHVPLLKGLPPSIGLSEKEVRDKRQDRYTHQRNRGPATADEQAAFVCRHAQPWVVVEEATDALDHEVDED